MSLSGIELAVCDVPITDVNVTEDMTQKNSAVNPML
jgi:hypothetical protein